MFVAFVKFLLHLSALQLANYIACGQYDRPDNAGRNQRSAKKIPFIHDNKTINEIIKKNYNSKNKNAANNKRAIIVVNYL